MSEDWEEKLTEAFNWSREQPGPKDVADEAEEYNLESISNLISKMEDAPSNCSTGFEKWKWYRNTGDGLGMGQLRESDS